MLQGETKGSKFIILVTCKETNAKWLLRKGEKDKSSILKENTGNFEDTTMCSPPKKISNENIMPQETKRRFNFMI